ncbi:hypothetical protein HYQ46_007034 [Verticillium longisporum]|nr:hypothetical protein HYQ46_007034 [Verticillium longisporum]
MSSGDGVATPLDGTIGPVGIDPGLERQTLAAPTGDGEVGLLGVVLALGPGQAEGGANGMVGGVAEPVDADSLGGDVGRCRCSRAKEAGEGQQGGS